MCDEPFYEIAARSWKPPMTRPGGPTCMIMTRTRASTNGLRFLQDEELTTPEVLMVLKYIHESGDESTPNKLADRFFARSRILQQPATHLRTQRRAQDGRGNFKRARGGRFCLSDATRTRMPVTWVITSAP